MCLFVRLSAECSPIICLKVVLRPITITFPSPPIRGTNASATWLESSHTIMVHWACWDGIRLDSRQIRHRLGFLCSCSNLTSRWGIQMARTQIRQQRQPEANHVKVRTGCQVMSPPYVFPSFKLSVSLLVDAVATSVILPIKNTPQPHVHWAGTASDLESPMSMVVLINNHLCLYHPFVQFTLGCCVSCRAVINWLWISLLWHRRPCQICLNGVLTMMRTEWHVAIFTVSH